MKKLFSILALTALFVLTSCGGGGGSCNINCSTYYTHEEVAAIFVDRLYTDLGYDVELVKTNTLQYDYIVVYDYDLGQYDAYYIGDFVVGENIGNYLNAFENDFSYDLIDNFDGTYDGLDYYGNWVTFEKGSKPGSKNLAKLAAFKQQYSIGKAADKLQAQYGLSLSTSKEIARATFALGKEVKANGRGSVTSAESVAIYKAVLGVNPTLGQDAFKSYHAGNKKPLNNMVDQMVKHFEGRESATSVRALFNDISGLEL